MWLDVAIGIVVAVIALLLLGFFFSPLVLLLDMVFRRTDG
jgi:hypothetical protein